MMAILFPDLPSFAKLIAQVTQKEIQIFHSLWEGICERTIDVLHGRLRSSLRNLVFEKRQVLTIVLQVGGSIK